MKEKRGRGLEWKKWLKRGCCAKMRRKEKRSSMEETALGEVSAMSRLLMAKESALAVFGRRTHVFYAVIFTLGDHEPGVDDVAIYIQVSKELQWLGEI